MKNVLLVTRGCDKNTVDTEIIAGALAQHGLRPLSFATWSGDDEPLDAVVVNTCGFIDEATQQSIDTILEWAEFKTAQGENPPRLIVAGCLSQTHADTLRAEIPEIDHLVGVGAWEQIATLLRGSDEAPTAIPAPDMSITAPPRRLPLDDAPHRFLRISDGCNQSCTFCSIPTMKGRLRSVPLDTLVDETRALLADGAREINLIAQDLTSYGSDMSAGPCLADLVAALDALDGDFWLRLLYAFPSRLDDRLIGAIAEAKHVVPYLDLPLQHASAPILRAMRRPDDPEAITALLDRLRAGIPDLVLRTTFIVGFPGETDADSEALLHFIEAQRFERVGAFEFQPQAGTAAATMPNQVPDALRAERHHRLMVLQQRLAAERQGERFAGKTLTVLPEAFEEEVSAWRTRSFADAPEVDGITWVMAECDALRAGEFAEVRVAATDPYDMRAEPA